jgi:preprotein translocase subunit SecD
MKWIFLLSCFSTNAFAADVVLEFVSRSDSIIFSASDISDVDVALDQGGFKVVQFSVTDQKAKAIEALTTRNVGELMDIKVCGRIVSSPTVLEPISGREMQISGAFPGMEAEMLAKQLTTDQCNPELTG